MPPLPHALLLRNQIVAVAAAGDFHQGGQPFLHTPNKSAVSSAVKKAQAC